MSLLYLPDTEGGLKSPNILWYYWAVQLRTIKFYFVTETVPQRKEMESEGLDLPLFMYLHSDKLSNLVRQTTNPIVKNMVKVWFDAKIFVKEPNVLSQYSPIWGNQYLEEQTLYLECGHQRGYKRSKAFICLTLTI